MHEIYCAASPERNHADLQDGVLGESHCQTVEDRLESDVLAKDRCLLIGACVESPERAFSIYTGLPLSEYIPAHWRSSNAVHEDIDGIGDDTGVHAIAAGRSCVIAVPNAGMQPQSLQVLSCKLPTSEFIVQGVTVEPYVLVRRPEAAGTTTADEVPEEGTGDSRHCLRFRWYRSVLNRGGATCWVWTTLTLHVRKITEKIVPCEIISCGN